MGELVIDFKNDGSVESLHMDGFDLGFLGDKKIFRQTDIPFCADTQKWNLVYLVGGDWPFHHGAISDFDTYEEARRFEVQWLNDCRLQGINPIAPEGVEVMQDLRNLKPIGPANDLVKSTFGCEHHKSVFE